MQIINSILKAVGIKPQTKAGNTVTSPIAPNGINSSNELPSTHYPIAGSVVSSDFINDSDIKRYKTVQRQWAESFSQRFGIPVENILARLPEIKLGNAKEMTRNKIFGGFDNFSNDIKMNPVREIVNLYGGGSDIIIPHESFHGYLQNLRRAYAAQVGPQQIFQEADFIVANLMRQGEQYPLVRGFHFEKINGQMVCLPKIMKAPTLSKNERQSLVDTIYKLKPEHLNPSTEQLNAEGEGFVKATLLPHLKDYPKLFNGNSEENEKAMCEKLLNYVNSFFVRRAILLQNLTSPKFTDLIENLKCPLNETEMNIARASFQDYLSTCEGNILIGLDPMGVNNSFAKSYFMSFEERNARHVENSYRQQIVNSKIETLKAQGLEPGKDLLAERQIVEHNIELLDQVYELKQIEETIVSAEKDPKKLIQLAQLQQQKKTIYENSAMEQLPKDIQIKIRTLKSLEEGQALLESLPTEQRQIAMSIDSQGEEILTIQNQLNLLDMPEKLLADNAENHALKSKFEEIMAKIRELAPKCDLSAIPIDFFSPDADNTTIKEATEIFAKWAKRLK